MGSGIDGNGSHGRRSRAQSRAGVIRAERARCVACGRGNACKRHDLDEGMLVVKVCRYCGHEQTVVNLWKLRPAAPR